LARDPASVVLGAPMTAPFRPAPRPIIVFTIIVATTIFGCRAKDATPEAAARTFWRALMSADAAAFRAIYPSRAELEAAFDAEHARRFLEQIAGGAAKLPSRPPPIRVLGTKVDKEVDVPPGKGLARSSRMARVLVRVRKQLPTGEEESDDPLVTIRIGEAWRVLPLEAEKLLP
jgi:hypothetical protein